MIEFVNPPLEGNCFGTLGSVRGNCPRCPFSEIDAEDRNQCTTGQGVERIPAYPALFVKAIDRQQQRDLRSREFDPVLRAPLPQSRFLGLVRKIFPLVDGAPPHEQILQSAVSASSAEDVANFVVVVG